MWAHPLHWVGLQEGVLIMTTINIKTYDSKTGKLIKNETKEVIEEVDYSEYSMDELREIGDVLGVKDNKKSDLIDKIKEKTDYESPAED